MKYLFTSMVVLFIAAACALPTTAPREITQADVRAMISEMEAATKSKDIDSIMSFLADDVEISITARGPLGSTKKTMGYEDFKRELRLGMSLTSDYEFRINIRSISIAPDSLSAVVVIDIYEVVEMMGVSAASFTKETSLLQRREGRLKAVRVSAESEMQITPRPGTGTPSAPEGI